MLTVASGWTASSRKTCRLTWNLTLAPGWPLRCLKRASSSNSKPKCSSTAGEWTARSPGQRTEYTGLQGQIGQVWSEDIAGYVYKEGKYDVTVRTSERAESVDDFKFPVGVPTSKSNFTHLLTVFGGVQGLELLLSNYWDLEKIEDPSLLFDCHLNTCPNQGSRTIRTEEALLVTMA